MNRLYKNYINSRGINGTSSLGRYAQTADNDIANCYLLQKQEIQNKYQYEQEEQKMIDETAEKIIKKFEQLQKDFL